MNLELAKRAVACKRWRWMAGMLTINGTRIQRTPNVEITAAWPDLDDPATLGCLLALVREAWNDDKIGLRWVEDDFGNDVCHIVRQRYGDWEMRTTIAASVIEAAALIAALEAAP